MDNKISKIERIFNQFKEQAYVGCGCSDTQYQKNLNRIIGNYIHFNDVDKYFMDKAEEYGYGIEVEDFEGCCTHGITYGCCPAGCEDPQVRLDYLNSIEERLEISDEKAHEIHISIMCEFAKIRCGVYDDMSDILLATNEVFYSQKLKKTMPNFSSFCDGLDGFLASHMNNDGTFNSSYGFGIQKDGYFELILKGVQWEDILGYFRHKHSIDWFNEARSEMEVAFFESIMFTVKILYEETISYC